MVHSRKKPKDYERYLEFCKTRGHTEKARDILREIGSHPNFPNWPNVSEKEKVLIWEYSGRSRFDKADCMFVKRMRDKIFGDDPLGFIQLM